MVEYNTVNAKLSNSQLNKLVISLLGDLLTKHLSGKEFLRAGEGI